MTPTPVATAEELQRGVAIGRCNTSSERTPPVCGADSAVRREHPVNGARAVAKYTPDIAQRLAVSPPLPQFCPPRGRKPYPPRLAMSNTLQVRSAANGVATTH